MVRLKLDQLKLEIQSYLGIPYYANSAGRGPGLNNAQVGKGSAKEIALETIHQANLQNIKLLNLTSTQIRNFQKKNHLGIDCSGLAFNLLKYIEPKVDTKLIGTEGKTGIRRLSANLLTSPPNSTKIFDYNSVQTGDLIRIDGGRHVIFIIEKIGDTIHYIHSSQKTIPSGVHLGSLTVANNQLTNWTETTKNKQDYPSLFNPANGDGIFRLFLLDQLHVF